MWLKTAAPGKETVIIIHESIILARRHHDSFEDPLTTAAAIDRVVHHSRIIEFGPEMTSVRAEAAARRQLQEFGQAQPDPT